MAKKAKNENEEKRAERLPGRSNFIEWYNAILDLAEIVDRSYPVKGTFVWMPYGMKLMKNLVSILDKKFEEEGIEETLFPLFVPINFAEINDQWFSGFKSEAYYTENNTLLLRPTGEPAMYPIFKLWIKRGKLPIRIYETVSSYRNESKTTHAMIRSREITFWHEIHTVHKTRDESVKEAELHKSIYEFVWRDILKIAPIVVAKPKYEIFAGADSAYEFYTILPDGRLLENGSVNNLGQAYAKKFDLSYIDDEGKKQYMWQVCTGNGARFIAAMIAVHGDDKGLVVSPKISPYDVVVVPIIKTGNKEMVHKEVNNLAKTLKNGGLKVYEDLSEVTAGEKFNIWELKGVPLRIEVGEREVNEGFYTIFRRDLNSKDKVKRENALSTVKDLLEKDIPNSLFEKSKRINESKIKSIDKKEDATEWIMKGGVVKANWCESKECFDSIVGWAPSVEPIGTLTEEKKTGKCISCGKKTEDLTLIGRTY